MHIEEEAGQLRRSLEEREARLKAMTTAISELRQVLVTQQNSAKELREQRAFAEAELAYIQSSLAYRLGRAITENISPIWRWLNVPFALIKAALHYRKHPTRKTALQKPSERRPTKEEREVLWQAQQIYASEGPEQAIAYAKALIHPHHERSVRLLEANAYLDDENRWLRLVNDYLSQFDVAPLDLAPGAHPRFDRIVAAGDQVAAAPQLVTVIMPAFNSQETLTHSVQSILHQTWQNLELIVVDDHSTDRTYEIARTLAETDNRIKVLRNSINVGPYVSKNRALKLARGSWITGHDADDWAHPQRIEAQIREMNNNPECRASIGQMIRMERDGHFSHFARIGKTSADGVLRTASISLFLEASFIREKLGYWDSVRFGGDSELIERCRRILGPGFLETPVLTMLCLDSEQSLTNHPEHGISKTTGISPVRQRYRNEWVAWHATLEEDDAFLDFPQRERKFEAPPEIVVPVEDIRQLDERR